MKQNPDTKMPAKVYKVYTARVAQTGTAAPEVGLEINQLGAAITWTRTGVGDYTLTAAGGAQVFTDDKTVFVGWGTQAVGVVTGSRWNTNSYRIRSWDMNGAAADGIMSNACIEIRVYDNI